VACAQCPDGWLVRRRKGCSGDGSTKRCPIEPSPTTPAEVADRDLPEFSRPPVIEVASSIQFAPIGALDAARLGLLWAEFRGDYPRTEYHAPLARFGGPEPSDPFTLNVNFSMGHEFPRPRAWFLSGDQTRLLQVQHDRIALNWRKLNTDAVYPRYRQLAASFRSEVAKVQAFLSRESLPAIQADHVELIYVNHIPGLDSGLPLPLAHIVRLWPGPPASIEFADSERVSLDARYVMAKDAGQKPIGRLYIGVEPRVMADERTPVVVLRMTARYRLPADSPIEGWFQGLDAAHTWIVRMFTEITTPEMHTRWERTR